MSQLPVPKLTYKHSMKDNRDVITVFDSSGKNFVSFDDISLDRAMLGASEYIRLKIEDLLKGSTPPYLREMLKPCEKKGDGRLPIDKAQWKEITLSDWTHGHLGVITQAELGRIRGVSRQAINQSVNRGDIEIFVWRYEKYVPFDTVMVHPKIIETIGNPMVLYYAVQKDKKKPRRRYKESS